MALKVIGSGMGRTGTHSLKVGLEKLLGAPCYHMVEVFEHMEHVPIWHAAAEGKPVDWEKLMEGYAAAVDWPAAAYWRELSEAFPDAIIVHSARDPESWWKSASETIFKGIEMLGREETKPWYEMVKLMMKNRFTENLSDKDACIAAFIRNNEDVLQNAPKDRLLVWQAKEGWPKLCEALNVPIPDEPFPVTNTTEEFQARIAARAP